MIYEEESVRHKKRSKAKPPKKADHKHLFEPCVLEYKSRRFDKAHGMVCDEPDARIDSYCPVCGKIGGLLDESRWWKWERFHSYWKHERTEEAVRELSPETRTLPTFFIEDGWFAKYVELKEDATNCREDI